jgi:hypothetical protein
MITIKDDHVEIRSVGNPNSIYTPAVWVVDARGGLRLASEAYKEPEVHCPQFCGQSARRSGARQNSQKQSRHASRSVKGVATIISKGA